MNDRNLAQRVGAAIAARRKQRGYTQSQLAERLSISQEALSRMEKGIISPKFSRLEDLADALGPRHDPGRHHPPPEPEKSGCRRRSDISYGPDF